MHLCIDFFIQKKLYMFKKHALFRLAEHLGVTSSELYLAFGWTYLIPSDRKKKHYVLLLLTVIRP